jgi:hypothetical protein
VGVSGDRPDLYFLVDQLFDNQDPRKAKIDILIERYHDLFPLKYIYILAEVDLVGCGVMRSVISGCDFTDWLIPIDMEPTVRPLHGNVSPS